jgi:hypothetical protein
MSALPAFLAGIGFGAALVALIDHAITRRVRADAAYHGYSCLLTTYPKTKGGRS